MSDSGGPHQPFEPVGPTDAAPPGAFGRTPDGTELPIGDRPAYGQPAYFSPAAVTPGAAAAAPPGWYPLPDGTTAWWDGVRWLVQPPSAPTARYRPIDGLTNATTVLLALSGLVSLAVAGTELNRYQLMGQIIDGAFVSPSEADAADGLTAAASGAYLLLLLATGVVFLIWLNRIYKNLDGPLRAGRLDYTSGWAVGWWFVPLANFVKPKQVVNEAWKASDPGSSDPAVPPTRWQDRKPPGLLSWWWAAWLSAGLISRVSVSWGSSDSLTAPESLRTGFLIGAVGAGLYVVAAVLAVMVVRSIAARHEARARNLAARGG